MKKLVLMVVLCFWVTGCATPPLTGAKTLNVKMGVIDTQKIMRESKAAKNARAVFFKDFESKRALLKKRQDEVLVLQEQLQKEGKNMSPSARKEKSERLASEVKELRRLKSDLEEELKKKDVELTRKVLQEIYKVVEEFFNKEKYTIILEKKSVVIYDEAIDITDKIIRLYDGRK